MVYLATVYHSKTLERLIIKYRQAFVNVNRQCDIQRLVCHGEERHYEEACEMLKCSFILQDRILCLSLLSKTRLSSSICLQPSFLTCNGLWVHGSYAQVQDKEIVGTLL